MNIFKEMWDIAIKLSNIKNMSEINTNGRKYDKHGFLFDLKTQVEQLDLFYTKLVDENLKHNPNETFYVLRNEPNVHQMAYINLGHGYPKELFGGHWCYILRKFRTKYLVIPSTSDDNTDIGINEDSEIPIKIKKFINNKYTTLQVRNLRCVDIQRVYKNKGYYDVETESKYIVDKLMSIITKDIFGEDIDIIEKEA